MNKAGGQDVSVRVEELYCTANLTDMIGNEANPYRALLVERKGCSSSAAAPGALKIDSALVRRARAHPADGLRLLEGEGHELIRTLTIDWDRAEVQWRRG